MPAQSSSLGIKYSKDAFTFRYVVKCKNGNCKLRKDKKRLVRNGAIVYDDDDEAMLNQETQKSAPVTSSRKLEDFLSQNFVVDQTSPDKIENSSSSDAQKSASTDKIEDFLSQISGPQKFVPKQTTNVLSSS